MRRVYRPAAQLVAFETWASDGAGRRSHPSSGLQHLSRRIFFISPPGAARDIAISYRVRVSVCMSVRLAARSRASKTTRPCARRGNC